VELTGNRNKIRRMGSRRRPLGRSNPFMDKQVEVQRNNVTLNAFFAAIKSACAIKGMELNIDRDIFENTKINEDSRYYIKDGVKHYSYNGFCTKQDVEGAAAQEEIYKTKPLDFQSYVKNFDGSVYNEICEFSFDDEKRGHGYYFQSNTEAKPTNLAISVTTRGRKRRIGERQGKSSGIGIVK
jgi:hypothetical protein